MQMCLGIVSLLEKLTVIAYFNSRTKGKKVKTRDINAAEEHFDAELKRQNAVSQPGDVVLEVASEQGEKNIKATEEKLVASSPASSPH